MLVVQKKGFENFVIFFSPCFFWNRLC